VQRLSLARAGDRPLYEQIAEHVRAEVAAGRLGPGERLPPIRELARRLGVNRDTAALAYEELAKSGVVESAVGRGTWIAAPAPRAIAGGPAGAPRLAPSVERLLRSLRARPRFGSGTHAVPMHGLVPDPSLYPGDEFRRVLNRVLGDGGNDLLVYGDPQGYPRLREVLAERFRAAGADVGPDEVVVCHGASQGISLALRLFAEPGASVAVEEPTYNNALAAAVGLGLETVPVPMREDGVDLEALDAVLARPDVRLFYTMPTFHNPLGTCTPLAHRRALLERAARHGKPVVEDGFEADLRFTGRGAPPLLALDRAGLVVQLSSFSKSLFPGVRVGALTVPGRLVEGLLALKQATDLSDAMPLQAALAEFVAGGAYDRHLARLRRVLKGRAAAVRDALARHMPEGARWTRPQGGYQVWVELPQGIDTADLLADAAAAGVLFVPGSQFHADGRPSSCLRLSFAMADEAALRRGVRALAGVVAERLARGGSLRRASRVPV